MLKAKKLFYIPIGLVTSYFTIDIVSNIYNRYVDFSDLNNIPLLFDALLQSKGQIVYLSLIIPIVLLYILFKSRIFKQYLFALTIIVMLFIIPSPVQSVISQYYIDAYIQMAYDKKDFWSPKVHVDYTKTGRISTFFEEGMNKQMIKHKISHYLGNRDVKLSQTIEHVSSHISKRNVYLIGLESFSLPKQLTNLTLHYKNDDANNTYDVIENASVVITSIFGGGTIQSEFEALCGVPALQKVSAFEFTEFEGTPTNCLPTILNSLNYSTILSNTHKAGLHFHVFNSIGFKDINFPKEYYPTFPSYLSNKNIANGEYAIFDSDLFNQNQNYVKETYLSEKKPIFNYMFSVWGHAFHEMTASNRPQAIEINNTDTLNLSAHTILAINQEYYRIKALQNYFDEIKLTDPTALVIAFSDHRPVLDGADSYQKYGLETDVFHNYIIIMDKGKYIKYDKPFPLYALPDIILDRLTDGWYCTHNKCKIDSKDKEQYLNDYYEIMANAMTPYSKENDFTLIPDKRYFFSDPTIPFIHFSQAETNYRWSDGKNAEIKFHIKNIDNLTNTIKLHLGTFGKQNISIYLNTHLLYKNTVNDSNLSLNLKYQKDWLTTNKSNTLHFDLPNAHKPNNGDNRILAIALKSFSLK